MAVQVVEKPRLSFWMVLIPFIFLHFVHRMQTFKAGVEACAIGFLHTKKRALDLALDAVERESQHRPEAGTAEGRGDVGPHRSELVAAAQLEEIRLCERHYVKLLTAGGETYEALVRNAYADRGRYAAFLEELERAESEVNRAALRALGEGEDLSGIATKFEAAAKMLREEEARAIFPG